MDKRTTIELVKNQDERTIQEIYRAFKPKFVNWLKGRYNIGNEEDYNEIYQRSFTVLFFNIKKGKLNDLTASIETYLFGIGKMVLKEWWREQTSKADFEAIETEKEFEQMELFSEVFKPAAIDERLQLRLAGGLKKLGEPCATIIKLFYWERNSMEAIANKLGYKNELGAKKKKYLCLNKLKELMQN